MRILLVDDHPLFLEGLRNLLTSRGFQVVGTAADGIEALAQARALHPDLILMDLKMPRCDGAAATRLIKAEMPTIQIAMLTVSEDENDLFEAIRNGASGYILKNLSADKFFNLLSALEQGEPAFAPGLSAKILQEFVRLMDGTDNQGAAGAEESRALTPRQVEILTLVAQGLTYAQVADTLCLTEATVKYHMREILKQLHLENRTQAVGYATRTGLTARKKKARET